MMILMCFLRPKGPRTQLAPGWKGINYDGDDDNNDDDDDDGDNNDDDDDDNDDAFSKTFFCRIIIVEAPLE